MDVYAKMRDGSNYKLRHGYKDGEDDWVITDKDGNTVLEINRYDLWNFEDTLKAARKPRLPKGWK